MADATAAVIVPPLVRALDAGQAKTDLRFVPLASRDPRLLLEHGQADLALGFFPELPGAIAAEGDGGSMQLEQLWSCEYVCVMRHDHPLAAQSHADAGCVLRGQAPAGQLRRAAARLRRRRAAAPGPQAPGHDHRQPVPQRGLRRAPVRPADGAAAQFRAGHRFRGRAHLPHAAVRDAGDRRGAAVASAPRPRRGATLAARHAAAGGRRDGALGRASRTRSGWPIEATRSRSPDIDRGRRGRDRRPSTVVLGPGQAVPAPGVGFGPVCASRNQATPSAPTLHAASPRCTR